MQPTLHLSLAVRSIDESVEFFTTLLGAEVRYRDSASGYVNLDFFGAQFSIAEDPAVKPELLPDFHFGVSLGLEDFERLSSRVLETGRKYVAMEPEVRDAGMPTERKKMFLRCPSGYLVELKGYKER